MASMMKRVLLAIASLVGVCQWLSAQSAEQMLFNDSLLARPSISSPWASLDSQDRFLFSTGFGSMRTTREYLPAFDPTLPLSAAYLAPGDSKSSVDRIVDLRPSDRVQFGGEMGVLYGKSTGKYGREDFSAYILGTVGNDKFSITAGFLHQETTFNNPRWRR